MPIFNFFYHFLRYFSKEALLARKERDRLKTLKKPHKDISYQSMHAGFLDFCETDAICSYRLKILYIYRSEQI